MRTRKLARELAATIMRDLSTPERLKAVEATESRFDEELWSKLAAAGLIGLSLPESAVGEGLASSRLASSPNRQAARLQRSRSYRPLCWVPLRSLRSEESLKDRWLPGVVAGTTILSAGLEEPGADSVLPTTTATPDGDGWRISGMKTCVPAGMLADAIVVAARINAGAAGPDGGGRAVRGSTDARTV